MVIAHNWSARLAQCFAASCLFGLLLFGLAGQMDLPMYWGYFVVCVGKCLWFALRMDPGLANERNRPGLGGVDHFTWHFSTLLFAAHWIIAPLDVGRLHWSASVPEALQLAGLLVFAVFGGLTIWAVVVNRFFSPVVRLQEDRGHHVVTLGPYRFIRHQ